ncbi:hypothetical protein PR202_ga28504 [Eleusine coracana subsp. coracana]|uniref:F-box domain-containing protein n=1 Tax=Eleusine coracana subsp. coracana TaxID=191504 RepID=A0AAV5DIQ1_ELECO|nr:hypothetical protein PR202_ga28504 [Eleusine coracana subsp. coracana]
MWSTRSSSASLVCKSWRRDLSGARLPPPLPRTAPSSSPARLPPLPPPDGLDAHHVFLAVYAWTWDELCWVQRKAVDLKALLPVHAMSFSPVIFYLPQGTDAIGVSTAAGVFVVQLSSGQPPPPELEDDAIRDILLRFPPTPLPLGSSKDLVRASLICKRWRRILLDPAFLRHYRALHRPPPLLGFLRYRRGWDGNDFFFHERFAVVEGDGLYLWSHPAGHGEPSLDRVVDLKSMLPEEAPVKFGVEKDAEIVCLATDARLWVGDPDG